MDISIGGDIMADEIKQLIDMVARLKIAVEVGFEAIDKRFDAVDKRFDVVETTIQELNSNQIKILNSIKLHEQDIRTNKKHIERLEERELYL